MVLEFFIEAMSQSVATIALTVFLCGLGIFAIIHSLGNQVLGALLYPFSVIASLCISKLFVDHHFYAQRAFDKWVLFTIFSAALGMGIALIAYIVLSRLLDLFRVQPKPADLNDLRVRRIQLEASRNP
jgi:hypothetical protein